MKIFVSHKKEDARLATVVATTLEAKGHDVYIDLIDDNIGKNGDDLGDYLRARLGECDSLIAVVSQSTKDSWWVPWEIGVATEKNYPLSTYLSDGTLPPDYLKKWPILRTIDHLALFAAKVKELQTKMTQSRKIQLSEKAYTDSVKSNVAEFHRTLKQSIGQ